MDLQRELDEFNELLEDLSENPPVQKPKPKPNTTHCPPAVYPTMSQDNRVHQVIDGLYIGSQDAAVNHEELILHSITHILNVACFVPNHFPHEFTYMCVEGIYDQVDFNITPYLEPCVEFIHGGLEGGGCVLVHCNAGVSRSASMIVAYLMKWKGLSLEEALEVVREGRRMARPNNGFLRNLRDYGVSVSGENEGT